MQINENQFVPTVLFGNWKKNRQWTLLREDRFSTIIFFDSIILKIGIRFQKRRQPLAKGNRGGGE